MLVLDVLDNGVPAAVVVDKVTVAGRVNDVQAEAHTVLFDNVGDRLDLGGLSDGLCGRKAALGLDEVRGEDGVDQGGLAETGLSNANNIELEAALQELLLDLGGDAVEADVALGEDALHGLSLGSTDVGHVGGGGDVVVYSTGYLGIRRGVDGRGAEAGITSAGGGDGGDGGEVGEEGEVVVRATDGEMGRRSKYSSDGAGESASWGSHDAQGFTLGMEEAPAAPAARAQSSPGAGKGPR